MDMKTVLISYLIINVICAGVIGVLYWQNRKHFNGLEFWLAAYFMQFAGLMLIGMRGTLPEFVSAVAGNGIFIGGAIMFYIGLERFLEKRSSQLHNYIILALFVAAHTYFLVVRPSMTARSINLSLVLILLCAQFIWLIFRRADVKMRPVIRDTGFVFAAYGAVSLIRICVNLVMPLNEDFFQLGLFDTAVIMAYQMLFIALTFSLFMMINRRLLMELQEDINERRQTGEILKQSEQLYHQMFIEHSAVKLLIDPITGAIVQANPAAAKFYGYSVEALETMNIVQINTLPWEAIYTGMDDALKRKCNYFTFQHCLASGERRDVEVHSAPIKFGGRELLYSIVHDITERKQAESQREAALEKMRESEERLRLAVSAGRMGIWDRNFITGLLNWSVECKTMFGLQPETEMNDENFMNALHPDDRLSTDIAIREAQAKRTDFNMEYRVIWPDGTLHWIAALGRWYYDETGQAIRMAGVTLDITERKRMEEDLREGEERYKSLYNNTPVMMHSIDSQGRLLSVSDYWLQSMGYTRDEVLGRPSTDFLTEDSRRYAKETALPQFLKTGQCNDISYQFVRKNGEVIDVLLSAISEKDAEGCVIRSLAVIIDITERKRAEEQLRESRETLSLFINHSPIYAFIKEITPTQSRVIYASENYADMIGIPGSEMAGKTMEELFPAEFAAKITADDWVVASSEGILNLEEELNGRQYMTIKFPLSQKDKATLLAGYTIDITERKRAEEELIKAKEESEKSEARFRKSLEFSPTPIAVADNTGKLIFLNKKFIDTYGYTLQDLPTIDQWTLQAYPNIDYRNLALQQWGQDVEYAIKNNTATPIRAYQATCKSGEVKTVEITTYFEKELSIGHFQDISERKRAEEALRLEQEFVNNALDTQPDTFFLFDFTSGKALRWNRAFREISGYSDEEIATLPAPVSYYSTEDLARESAVIQRIQQGESAAFVMDLICKDGRKVPTEYQAAPLKDEKGDYRFIIAIGRDITERKKAETELRATHETLQTQFYEINTLKETLQEQAIRDPLTRLHNRRYLDETLNHEAARAKRENYPISVMMIDIDHFKNFNDTYGHSAGDEVLKSLSRLLVESIRQGDIACRYGGEEFLIVMISAYETDVVQRAEAICQDFSRSRIRFNKQELSATVSIGVAFYPRHGTEIQQVISTADAAMYQAKQAGRNRVHVWEAK